MSSVHEGPNRPQKIRCCSGLPAEVQGLGTRSALKQVQGFRDLGFIRFKDEVVKVDGCSWMQDFGLCAWSGMTS